MIFILHTFSHLASICCSVLLFQYYIMCAEHQIVINIHTHTHIIYIYVYIQYIRIYMYTHMYIKSNISLF